MTAYMRLASGRIQRMSDHATFNADDATCAAAEYRERITADPSCVADEPAPPLTEDACIAAIQARLDAHAKSWGYDDLKSAATYAGDDEDLTYAAEGMALRRWRSRTWRVGTQVLAEQAALIAAGKQPTITTIADLLALLPAPPDRPA